MILAIDIGNTTVALGGIRDGRVCFVARMDTVRTRTAAEYRVEMDKIFAHRRHPERPMRFEGAVLTSVCLLYTSPSPRDSTSSRMPSSA